MSYRKNPLRTPPLALAAVLVAWAVVAAIPAPRAPPLAPLTPLNPDVNRAPVDELILLPGVGPHRAGSIVDSRSARGSFGRLDDLVRVHGIGPKTVEGLRGVARVREAGP